MTICLILGWKVRKTFGEVWQQGLLVCRPGLLKTATQATQATQAHVKQSNPSWPVTFALQHPLQLQSVRTTATSNAWQQSSPNHLKPLQFIACTALHSMMHHVAKFKRTSCYSTSHAADSGSMYSVSSRPGFDAG